MANPATIGSPRTTSHHLTVTRQSSICPAQVRRSPSPSVTTIAPATSGPNPPRYINPTPIQMSVSVPSGAISMGIVIIGTHSSQL